MRKRTKRVHIEDMLTIRLRRDNPDVQRIGVERGPNGWRCHPLWLHKDGPALSKTETAEILAEANKLLAQLLQEFEIEEEQRATG